MANAKEYFVQLPQFGLLICRECKYAVWPDQIDRHLRGNRHELQVKIRRRIISEIESWTNLIQNRLDFKPPLFVDEIIPELRVYHDGLECACEELVCRDEKYMKKHLKATHEWMATTKKGGLSKSEATIAREKFNRTVTRNVTCQRFFPSRQHSQYIKVQDQQQDEDKPVSLWQQLASDGDAVYDAALSEMHSTIQPGDNDEVDPWLLRTGWVGYLKNFNRASLLARIVEPANPTERIVWKATVNAIRKSQETTRRCGVMLQIAAHQFEPGQREHKPLKPYLTSLAEKAIQWQRIVMFFVRGEANDGPRYSFTVEQRAALERLMEEAARLDLESDVELETAFESDSDSDDGQKLAAIECGCLDFCVELLNQQTEESEYESPLVCALAVLGVTESGWKTTLAYPSMLSSIIKCARFMVLHTAIAAGGPGEARLAATSVTMQTRNEGPRFKLDCMMKSFMLSGTASPMDWMMSLRAYGLAIARQRTAGGSVIWDEDSRLIYKDKRFTMPQFASMVHGLVQEAAQILHKELLFCDEPPPIPWASIRDTPAKTAEGWCFLDDDQAAWPDNGKGWLFKRLEGLPKMRARFEDADTASGVSRKGTTDYRATVGRFLEKLLVLMHMTGGQPARGPEILSIRTRNTAAGKLRNVFIEDGLVVFVTLYHKGYEMSAQEKIVHRYLPREVGELLVRYLWLVDPFNQRMQRLLGQRPLSFHLWPKQDRWSSGRLKHALHQATGAALGHSLGIREYREVAIAISRRFLRPKLHFDDEDEDGDDVADLQAGHGSRLANALYARESHELSGTLATLRDRFRQASLEWHRFLGFSVSTKRRNPYDDDADSSRKRRWRRLRELGFKTVFQQALPEATPRSAQIEAYDAIKEGDSPVVVVMPTGSGKSMLFTVPAMVAPNGVTVVVVPILALQADIVKRCSQMAVSCRPWSAASPPDDATVVVVTPEAALEKPFASFLGRLHLARRLDRIVIDECHVILNDSSTFRPRLQELGQLLAHEAQMVLLTATLPPSLEPKLWERMAWQEGQGRVVRAPTTRVNIRYSVVRVSSVHHHIEDLVRGESGKTVIFCISKAEVDATVERLGRGQCRGFHSRMDEADKLESLRQFGGERVNVVAATSALGVGVDLPCVRRVIHAGEPRDMVDYAQESGRAGRDGTRAEAVIVQGPGAFASRDEVMMRYLKAGCRRAVLDEYLDGRKRTSCAVDEAPCDGCLAEPVKRPAVYDHQLAVRQQLARQLQNRQAVRSKRSDRVLERLQQWTLTCVICKARDGHYSLDCPAGGKSRLRRWASAYQPAPNAGCYECLVPMGLCDSRVQDDEGKWQATGEPCQFKQVMAAVVFGLDVLDPGLNQQWMDRLQTKHKINPKQDGAVLRFLAKYYAMGRLQASNLFWEFDWITERLKTELL
jgi:superfamily II DNA helicase RecQ